MKSRLEIDPFEAGSSDAISLKNSEMLTTKTKNFTEFSAKFRSTRLKPALGMNKENNGKIVNNLKTVQMKSDSRRKHSNSKVITPRNRNCPPKTLGYIKKIAPNKEDQAYRNRVSLCCQRGAKFWHIGG